MCIIICPGYNILQENEQTSASKEKIERRNLAIQADQGQNVISSCIWLFEKHLNNLISEAGKVSALQLPL